MLRWTRPFSRRAMLASALAIATISGAGAATYHRFAVTTSNGGGSGGALEVLQTNSSGGAVQGEVASSADTSFSYPFGLFGIYDGSSSTFGVGMAGMSSTGYGVAGASKSANASILAYAEGSGPALQAVTKSSTSNAPAIYAAPASGAAADGIDAETSAEDGNDVPYYAVSGIDMATSANSLLYNSGVYGFSLNLNGVFGMVQYNNNGVLRQNGVFGVSTGTTYGSGVQGYSDLGTGVAASSNSGDAIYSEQYPKASPAPLVSEEDGVYASSQNGAGVYSYSAQDPAIVGEMGCNLYLNNVSEQGQNCSGLFIQEDGTQGYPLLVYEPNTTQTCSDPKYPFFVNSAGDVYECGTTTTSYVYQRNSNPASDAVTYAAKQTESTVEDFGSAQLVNGSASVALAADFRQTINANAPYMVFMTPHGNSHGLYLESQSQNGFVVRENDGGRSSMAFDYRIVARPYGERPARLPHESQIIAHRPTDRPSDRKSYAQLIAAAEARNRTPLGVNKDSPIAKLLALRPRRYVPPPIPANFASALQRVRPNSTP